jgi:hypothetical protein
LRDSATPPLEASTIRLLAPYRRPGPRAEGAPLDDDGIAARDYVDWLDPSVGEVGSPGPQPLEDLIPAPLRNCRTKWDELVFALLCELSCRPLEIASIEGVVKLAENALFLTHRSIIKRFDE